MVDTCVMCGITIPEDTQICLHCRQKAYTRTICPDCGGHLQIMYTNYSYAATGLVRSTLYHCSTCSSDWELDVPFIEQSSNFKRKFWG